MKTLHQHSLSSQSDRSRWDRVLVPFHTPSLMETSQNNLVVFLPDHDDALAKESQLPTSLQDLPQVKELNSL